MGSVDPAYLKANLRSLPLAIRNLMPQLQALEPLDVMPCRKAKQLVTAQVVTRDQKKVLLHSKYDPIKEAQALAQGGKGRTWVLAVGFGLGYQCEAARQMLGRQGQLTIAVPDLRNLWTAIHYCDLRMLFEDERVSWMVSRDAQQLLGRLAKCYRDFDDGLHFLLTHQPALQSLSEPYATLSYIFRRRTIEQQTIQQNRDVILSNIQGNLGHVLACPGIQALRGVLRGKPSVIAASGPSLDQQLDWLRAYRDQVALISASSALAVLQSKGIEPDLVVCIDPKAHIVDQMRGMCLANCGMVATPSVIPGVFKLPFAKTYVAYSKGDPLMEALERECPRGLLETGDSVANTALSLAHWMGATQVALMGQDLALGVGEQTHATGVVTSYMEVPRDFEKVQVKGVFEQPVVTLKKWLHYLEWIEWFAQSHPQLRLVQAGASGARIQGSKHVKLADWLHDVTKVDGDMKSFLLPGDRARQIDPTRLRGLEAWFTSFLAERG